ncbi:uncharacterized protein Tco025E_08952 [Trypanosoma conorhini]|uniref:Thioredoxin domain-containing protein n=1 Tax=Trypanosoma conorhini TaxID=83891 RepID=A0A3R7MBS0_9TRYP|nr:uncharacterized protein Tco025E_08952 [Trypanosoma conorhini]RNE99691.1 hypothetical protein Tco025E_08952 [Trypanosoma conorhini]
MGYSAEKRARKEPESAALTAQREAVTLVGETDSALKKPRLDGDGDGTAALHKLFAEFDGEQQQQQQQHSENGVSPDSGDDDSEKGEAEASEADVEDLMLFTSPTRARLEVAARGRRGAGAQCKLVPSSNQPLDAVHERRRVPHTVGAVTTLYSVQQLEELLDAAPLPPQSSGVLAASASAPPQLQLRAGETVLIVLQNGQGGRTVALQHATEGLSQCRIFRLDLGELPPCEYEEVGAETHEEQDDAAGLLRLFHTDPLLSLSTQGPQNIEHALQRVSSLLRVGEVLNPGGAASPDPAPPEKTGDAGGKSVNVAHPEEGEVLTLPALVMWRADGGPADEYCRKVERQTGGAHKNDKQGNFQMAVTGARHRGWPLVVKELTTLDQLHSASLLTPVYTVTHFLRTVCAKALFPEGATAAVAGTRTLIYFGASWCPPCMRIVNALPAMMKEDFPSNLTCAVKADMDLATPLFEFFGVEIIPTFLILDNDVLRTAGGWEALRGPASTSEEALSQLSEGLRRAELGRVQNSQRMLVRMFIESHTCGLKFDDDF